MITKKKVIIPIFDYHMKILIYDDKEELRGYINDSDLEGYFRGMTIGYPFECIVAIDAKHGSTIAHEALHVVNGVWRSIGYQPQRDNDEVSAYLLTYIYNKITDVWYKHKENKTVSN